MLSRQLFARSFAASRGLDALYGRPLRIVHVTFDVTRETLADQHVNSAILVTSWYHTGRALAVFRKVWPEVAWGAHGVFPGDTLAKSVPIYEAGSILAEYVKRAWYAVRYWA